MDTQEDDRSTTATDRLEIHHAVEIRLDRGGPDVAVVADGGPEAVQPKAATRAAASPSQADLPVTSRARAAALFGVTATMYLLGGVWLIRHGALPPEAIARTARAWTAVSSRDPHLAAIGFTMAPLPTVIQLPLVALATLWPPLVATGTVAVVQSAAFAAGTGVLVRRILRDVGVGPRAATAMTVGFAVHPEIAWLGVSGTADAAYLFFVVLSALLLMRWAREGTIAQLAGCGLALAAGYLCRDDLVTAAAACLAVVSLASWRRPTPSPGRRRRLEADTLLLLTPLATAVLVWSVACWTLAGSPITSLGVWRANGSALPYVAVLTGPWSARLVVVARQLLTVAPLGALVLGPAVVLALRARNRWRLAPLLVLGCACAAPAVVIGSGQAVAVLRLCASAVALSIVAAGVVLRASLARTSRPPQRRLIAGSVVSAVVVSVLVSYWATCSDRIAVEEQDAFAPALVPWAATAAQRETLRRPHQDHALAAWLDAQQLRPGTVVMDAPDGYGVVLASQRPEQFTLSTDRDFDRRIGAPTSIAVTYMVKRQGAGTSQGMRTGWASPATGRLVLIWTAPNDGDLPDWQVYGWASPVPPTRPRASVRPAGQSTVRPA